MGNRLWVTPNNDLEAKAIVEMLQREEEDFLVTGQAWGASWAWLEPHIFKSLNEQGYKIESDDIDRVEKLDLEIDRIKKELYKLESQEEAMTERIDELKSIKDKLEQERTSTANNMLSEINKQAMDKSISIYGVELQGDSNGAINVDHHTYGEDDRSNKKSSIEQVAEILGVELTLDEQFVSANDKGYIPVMKDLGAKLGLSEEDLQAIIDNIRMRDREMQGITPEQEAQAQEAVDALGEITEKRKYIQIDLPHSKTATITDRLYGKYDNLLIVSGDGETNFYGATEIIQMLNEKFPGGWSGGQLDQGSGFWGGYADQEAIKEAVQSALQKEKEEDREV